MSGKERIYWDSCVFIAHLTNEVRADPLDMLGVNELATLADMSQIDLATSTLTLTEVLQSTIDPKEYKRFRMLFVRRNYFLIDVTARIADIAHEIRNHYYQPGTATIAIPDCIHLATAIWFKCGTFYTFDGSGSRPGLLTLSTPIAGKYDILVKKPRPTIPPTPAQPPQMGLPFTSEEEKAGT